MAQSYTKKTLITIGDKEVSVKEFMDTYEKNNVNTEVIDKKNVDEYLDLYIDFKLKVAEAEYLKMDTVPSFVKELKNYRDQLAKPYFSNDDITEELVKEAYERIQYDINAAHILIKCDVNAVPSDTMAAYKKAPPCGRAFCGVWQFSRGSCEPWRHCRAPDRCPAGKRRSPQNRWA